MNAFIKKLVHFAPLSRQELTVLVSACADIQSFPAGANLARIGEKPRDLHIILEGFACRSKIDADGRRSIVSYLVPGDIGDQHAFILKALDHTVSTLSPCLVATIPQEEFLGRVERHPRIVRALWWSALVDEATSREWILNIAARQGPKRLAHLLCELLMRLETVGLVKEGGYSLPVTQTELGQTIALSTVHVNRVLRSLRERNLVTWEKKRLVIPDVRRLKAFCSFTPAYLHLERDASHNSRPGR